MTELLDITLRSLLIAGSATLLAMLWSIPIALWLSMREFRGKQVVKSVFTALIGMPTVALGLILYLIFSNSGPLGSFGLLFTPTGIIIGEAILITPIIVSFAYSALDSVDPEVKDLARTLGASEKQASLAVLSEARKGTTLSIVAAFNRAIAELGVALMIGGNIRGYTQVLTTAISKEVAMGEIALSIQMTAVLLLIVFSLTLLINLLRRD
ncbi:MAG: ABC transporter permease [Candidatus Hadarchaeota archaeon]